MTMHLLTCSLAILLVIQLALATTLPHSGHELASHQNLHMENGGLGTPPIQPGKLTTMQILGASNMSEADAILGRMDEKIPAEDTMAEAGTQLPRPDAPSRGLFGSIVHWFQHLVGASAPDLPFLSDDEVAKLKDIGQMAGMVFCGSQAELQAMNCTRCLAFQNKWQDVQVIEGDSGEVRAMVGYRPESNQIFVSFRGSATFKNWIVDFQCRPVKLNIALPDWVKSKVDGQPLVHRGFQRQYMYVRDAVVAAVVRQLAAHAGAAVVATGHSMGGSLAQLLVLDLAGRGILAQGDPVALVTFGAPRTGNAPLAAAVEAAARAIRRVTEAGDAVPRVPFMNYLWMWKYTHTRGEVYAKFGRAYACRGREDPACADAQKAVWFPPAPFHSRFLGKRLFGVWGCKNEVY